MDPLTAVHSPIIYHKKLTVLCSRDLFSHFHVLAGVWTLVLLLTTWVYMDISGSLVSHSTSHSNVTSYLNGSWQIFSFHIIHSTSPEHIFRVWQSVFLLILLEVQVLLHRLYESLYVLNYNIMYMHIFGYLSGIL